MKTNSKKLTSIVLTGTKRATKHAKVNIIICGYGHLGSRLYEWIERKVPSIKINAIVEPDLQKHSEIKEKNLLTYPHILNIPNTLIKNTDVIVDASTAGQGIKNMKLYKSIDIPAIFQSGEGLDVAKLYYPGLTDIGSNRYLRIPCCSAISTLRIIRALKNKHNRIDYILGYHVKINNKDQMIEIDYKSGYEVSYLTGIKTCLNRIYLRGEPDNNEFVYCGNLELVLRKQIQLKEVIELLKNHNENYLSLVDSHHDSKSATRTADTLVIQNSLHLDQNRLSLCFISYPPEIDFPANIAAINELSLRT